MILDGEFRACNPRVLDQGDVFPDVVFLYPTAAVNFVERMEIAEFDGVSAFVPSRSISDIALVHCEANEAIVLSFSCELDRILRRIDTGKPLDLSDVATIAPVYLMTKYNQKAQHQVRSGNQKRYLVLQESEQRAERVVDFSAIQAIPVPRLLQSCARRVNGLNVYGRVKLMKALASHLGDDERRKSEGSPEPDLLQAVLEKLGLPIS